MSRSKTRCRFSLSEYYKTKHWKELSKKIRAETPYCELCGSKKRLQVHHKTYFRIYREKRSDLQVLCEDCHLKEVHQQKTEDDMLDFNHENKTGRLVHLIDEALQAKNAKQKPRAYLGGSRLGVECQRALQFEFFNTPKDEGKEFSGQTLRTFQIGHVLEDMAAGWLRDAGLDLRTANKDGRQFGFETGRGFIAGHVDGVIVAGPDEFGPYPRLWECKTANSKNWRQMEKHKIKKAKWIYYIQCQLYMAYMELSENPALFTAVNKDTSELYFENVEFDPSAAQDASDRGVRIIEACLCGELLPRITEDPSFYQCKWCAWADRCWSMDEREAVAG
jgi:hypothetical protein